MPLANPVGYAQESRKAYLVLNRFFKDSSIKDEPAANAGYRETLFHISEHQAWDTEWAKTGIKSARQIEKAVRMQDDIGGEFNGKTIIERYAGFAPVIPDARPAPANNKLNSPRETNRNP